MTIRKVYGSLNSPATLKVIACLVEHGLDFEFVPVNLKDGDHKKNQFLTMNPFGQVPVYEDGDTKQFESRAIIRSMSHQHSKQLGDEDLIFWDVKKQAVVANWVDVEDHQFEPPARRLISQLLISPKLGIAPNEDVVLENQAKLSKVLDIYEARLAKFKHLAADKYTIVDLLHLPNLQLLMGTKVKELFEARPRVHAWCLEILARPAWVKVLEMQKESLINVA